MAGRDSLHQPGDREGGLVQSRSTIRNAVFLPYERVLCEQLGISEQEYQWFKEELAKHNYVRPAEYAHIPDIRCDPTTVAVLINLAIGLALSGISMLLAPKMEQPESKQRTRKYSNINGRDRYAPIYGFDSVSDVASLGDPVPLIWTRRQGQFGGVVVEPKLIWSRIYSYGNTQVVKMLYAVGEPGITPPAVPGLWLGNNGVDILDPSSDYAFYFGNTTDQPPVLYGSKGENAGDPTAGSFPNFSQVWTPSNNSTFGVSNPIPNGTDFRVNWAIVNLFEDASPEAKAQARMDRRKICGYPSVNDGMKGIGVGYPRRQGYVNGSFLIVSKYLKRDLWQEENVGDDNIDVRASVTDINKELDAECAATDDLMQKGEKFMSGSTIFKVTGRSLPIWLPKGPNQVISLQQIEDIGGHPAQSVEQRAIENNEHIHINGEPRNGGRPYNSGYYTFLRFTESKIKNTRPCDVTEVGIKSVVWNRVSGFCNVNDMPYPDELKRMDRNNVQVQTGQISRYFRRTCGFKVQVRGVGSSVWLDSQQAFVIRGATPQPQYNYLRFQHTRGLYEYRFIPLNGTILSRMAAAGATAIHLNAAAGSVVPFSVGNITGECRGSVVRLSDCTGEELFWQDEGDQNFDRRLIPKTLTYQGVQGGRTIPYGRREAILYNILGDPSNLPEGTEKFAVIQGRADLLGTGKTSKCAILIRSRVKSIDIDGQSSTPLVKGWDVFDFWVWDHNQNVWPDNPYLGIKPETSSTKSLNWAVGTRIRYQVNVDATNPYHISNLKYGSNDDDYNLQLLFTVQSTIYADGVNRPLRQFEREAQIHDVSHYGSLIEHSCDSGPEHEITYVNEIRNYTRSAVPLCAVGIALRANRNFTSLDQLRMYVTSGVNNSNSFPELALYMLKNVAVRGSLRLAPELIDESSFASAAAYCQSNQLYFDGVVAERTNLRSFLAETAPFFLLTLTISNGKLGLRPMIPSGGPVQMFTAGNIVDGSLKVDTIDTSQRRDFQALMIYRVNELNQLPETRSVRLAYDTSAPMEQFDMSAYCTNREHAIKVGRFFLALRKHVTKQISFQTTPDQATLGPGDLVSLSLDTAVVRSMETGTIDDQGRINSAGQVSDGPVTLVYWRPGNNEVKTVAAQVSNGAIADPALHGAVFAVQRSSVTTVRVLVETVNLTEDGLVEIQGTDFPDAIASDTFTGAGIGIHE
jgi:hypothetical protein